MLSIKTAVDDYFSALGFEPEVAAIYLTLQMEGPQHIASLSRLSGVERTKIYRLIDVLLEAELITVTTQGTRGIMQAAPIANIRALLARRESELKALQRNLELLELGMKQHHISNPLTHVELHEGAVAIRNVLKAASSSHQDTTIYALCSEPLEQWLSAVFIQEWSTLLSTNGSHVYLLYASHAYSLLEPWRKQQKVIQSSVFETRVMQSNTDEPANCLLMWPDSIASIEQHAKGLYATHIKNRALTALNRRYFESLWQKYPEA